MALKATLAEVLIAKRGLVVVPDPEPEPEPVLEEPEPIDLNSPVVQGPVQFLKGLIKKLGDRIAEGRAIVAERLAQEYVAAKAEHDKMTFRTRRERDEAESRLYGILRQADEAADDDQWWWIWKEDVVPILTVPEKVFMGMEREREGRKVRWVGGYWRRDGKSILDGETRRYLDHELIGRIAARKMADIEACIEGDAETTERNLNALMHTWKTGYEPKA